MNWQKHDAGDRYTLVMGPYTAMVQPSGAVWRARTARTAPSGILNSRLFPTLDDAGAWCIAPVTDGIARGDHDDGADDTSDLRWEYDGSVGTYSLTIGDGRAMVGRSSRHDWTASVGRQDHVVDATRCRTLKEAQHWSEAQLQHPVTGKR